MKRILYSIFHSYLFIALLAILLGLFLPSVFKKVSVFSTVILGVIFFLSSLKIDVTQIKMVIKDWKVIFLVCFSILFIIPIVVYFITLNVYQPLALAFLLLAVMPAGMTSPLLSELAGGKQSLALVLTIITSLLAPITIPFMIKALAGHLVSVDFWSMFRLLSLVIYLPFILAQIVKRTNQHLVEKISPFFKTFSTLLLGILIAGVVARQSSQILGGIKHQGEIVYYFIALFILFIFLHIFGYFIAFWKDREDRITITICLAYMNFTLAIELSNKFFPEPNVLLPVVFSVIPWALFLVPFSKLVKKRDL